MTFHYTLDYPTQEKTDVLETAKIIFTQIPNRPRGTYQVKSGRIDWGGSSEDTNTGCKWTASGARPPTVYDAYFDMQGWPVYKAWFSSLDWLEVHVTSVCPPPYSTFDHDVDLIHPFFVLTRKTRGVRVNKKLNLIAGRTRHSLTTSSGTEAWTYKWSFHALR